MSEDVNRQLVVEFWERLGRFDFEGAGELLHDDFMCDWPQSNERIRGRANFVALNANYPGRSPSASPARCAGYDGSC